VFADQQDVESAQECSVSRLRGCMLRGLGLWFGYGLICRYFTDEDGRVGLR
jgi:hypothetical protein